MIFWSVAPPGSDTFAHDACSVYWHGLRGQKCRNLQGALDPNLAQGLMMYLSLLNFWQVYRISKWSSLMLVDWFFLTFHKSIIFAKSFHVFCHQLTFHVQRFLDILFHQINFAIQIEILPFSSDLQQACTYILLLMFCFKVFNCLHCTCFHFFIFLWYCRNIDIFHLHKQDISHLSTNHIQFDGKILFFQMRYDAFDFSWTNGSFSKV